MSNYITAQSQVTFLYYDDLAPVVDFYENILEFELVEDQQWAKIYRTSGSSFIGLVDGTRGFRKPLANSAVLCTLVVDDVPGWYERLKARGVKILREPQVYAEIQVHCFFFEDPGGYAYEVEQFLKPELVDVFHKDAVGAISLSHSLLDGDSGLLLYALCGISCLCAAS
ncbi:MAG: VOC family protein [Caldilineaceae bacterium]